MVSIRDCLAFYFSHLVVFNFYNAVDQSCLTLCVCEEEEASVGPTLYFMSIQNTADDTSRKAACFRGPWNATSPLASGIVS